MKIIDIKGKEIEYNQLNDIFSSNGWKTRSSDLWNEVISKSYKVYVVVENNKIIGMGRIVEDGVMCMVYDVIVLKDLQSKGVGKLIMTKIIDTIKDKDYLAVELFAWDKNPMLKPFYSKFGFESVEGGMKFKK